MPPAADNPLLFADHEEIQDIARQIGAHQGGDRPLRPHAPELGPRSRPAPRGGARRARPAATTCARSARRWAVSRTTSTTRSPPSWPIPSCCCASAQTDSAPTAGSWSIRDVALEASATVRRLQEFVSRQPQVAFGPVGLPAVIAEALELTAPRWRDDARAPRRRHHGHAGHGGAAARRGQSPSSCATPSCVSSSTRCTPCPEGGALGHPGRQRGVGLGGRRGADTGIGHVGGAAPAPGRARARASSRAGAAAGSAEVADIVERHGGQHDASRARSGRGTTVRLRLHASRFQIIPPSEGAGASAGASGAGRARAPRGRRPAPAHRALRHAAQRAATPSPPPPTARRPSQMFDPRAARRGHHRSRHAQDERLGGGRAHQDALARDRGVPPHRLGRGRRRRTSPASSWTACIAKPVSAEALLEQLAGLHAVPRPARVTPPVPPSPPSPPPPCCSCAPGAACPVEVYMIRRQKSMRFLGGFYAFPGGKVESGRRLARTPRPLPRHLAADAARASCPAADGIPPLAFWVAAARELLEETGLLAGLRRRRPAGGHAGPRGARPRGARSATRWSARRRPSTCCSPREDWYLDLAPFRYLSHFITPPSSPIRFTARFFLAPVPAGPGAAPASAEEASEGFWIDPAEGHRRLLAGEMPMAEPADCGLGYLAGFDTLGRRVGRARRRPPQVPRHPRPPAERRPASDSRAARPRVPS